jgi:hypothetical protein
MPRIGHRARRLIAAQTPECWAFAGALVALFSALKMWDFTVDDALIGVRYARHVAGGHGWRFDVHAPPTDGVTPLPWPLVLLPFAHGPPLAVLARAKAIGLVAWVIAGAVLGHAIGATSRCASWVKLAILAAVALSVPLSAHAVSGMETSLATLLATLAAVSHRRPFAAAILGGCAASLRPEMAPWAVAVSMGFAVETWAPGWRCLGAAALALGPFTSCALIRWFVWGRPAPLALWAKPSDVHHGLAYVGAALVVTVVPLLAAAPVAAWRSPVAASLLVAAAVHALALVLVGGDWMPYARLMVPIVPSLAYAGAVLAVQARPWATAARGAGAITLGLFLQIHNGGQGRHVGQERAELIRVAQPWLEPFHAVAALDIGWVGAATEQDIVDLAGLTDPAIAALAGGHTSKRVSGRFLLDRNADALLLYASAGMSSDRLDGWQTAIYPRRVEARLAEDPVVARRFVPLAWLPLGERGAGYVLLQRNDVTAQERRPSRRSRPPLLGAGAPASRACWIR